MEYYVICRECAIGADGRWPEGHLATISVQHCNVCGKHTACASMRDWGYPTITDEYRDRRIKETKNESDDSSKT